MLSVEGRELQSLIKMIHGVPRFCCINSRNYYSLHFIWPNR